MMSKTNVITKKKHPEVIYARHLTPLHVRHFLAQAGRSSSVGSVFAWNTASRGFDPYVWQHSFVEFGHEIISKAFLSLPLIQEGQLSVTGEKNVH